MNTLTGVLRALTPVSQTFFLDAADPKIYGTDLYFTNRNDQKLYRLSLAGLAGAGGQ